MTGKNNSTNNSDDIVQQIKSLFEKHSNEWYMGEDLSISQHMLQSAYFADKSGADDELIIAALLHDIGHYTCKFSEDCLQSGVDNNHEDAGADFLESYFPSRVIDPIRLHVATKRYLCATEPNYYAVLSEASKQSLQVQGGPMNDAEVTEFETEPNFKDAIRVRHWDEASKDPALAVPSLDYYEQRMRDLLID